MIDVHHFGNIAAGTEPETLYQLAFKLGQIAKEIERDEIVEGSSAELVSDVLARGDSGDLVREIVAHARRTEPLIDPAALAAAITADAAGVWCELVGELLARGGVGAVAHELRLNAARLRTELQRRSAEALRRQRSWLVQTLARGGR
jgi:hypothetical protein